MKMSYQIGNLNGGLKAITKYLQIREKNNNLHDNGLCQQPKKKKTEKAKYKVCVCV